MEEEYISIFIWHIFAKIYKNCYQWIVSGEGAGVKKIPFQNKPFVQFTCCAMYILPFPKKQMNPLKRVNIEIKGSYKKKTYLWESCWPMLGECWEWDCIYVYLTVKHTGILLKNIIMHFPNIRFRNITKTEKLFDMWQRAGPSMITPQPAVPKTPDSSGAGKLALSSFHIRALQSGASPYWNFQYKELKESENALSLTQEERRRLYKTSMIIVQQPIFNFLLTWKSSKCIVIPKN